MARQANSTVENNFVQGLITENTALNFPENACTDTVNCVFSETGRVTRRGEIDLEPGYDYNIGAAYSGFEMFEATSEYMWTNPGGTGSTSFLVQQIGTSLYFYDVSTSTTVSPNLIGTVNLLSYDVSGTPYNVGREICQYAQGNDVLIVTNRACDPMAITWDGLAFSVESISIRYRDFEGLRYTNLVFVTNPTHRPSTSVSSLRSGADDLKRHFYNLLNQGWWNGTWTSGSPSITESALGQWDTARTDVPGNCDAVGFFRASPTDAFDDARVIAYSQGTSIVPKGHFILSLSETTPRHKAFTDEGFSYLSGTDLTTIDPLAGSAYQYARPSCCAFFAGRVWYAGLDRKSFSTTIFFSQTIESPRQYGLCYQENDPTSEEFFDLLETDGGAISIPEIGKIIRLWPYQNSLLVFASNGVWIVRGTTSGFSPLNYTIRKLSSLGTQASMSFVDYRGLPIWWGEEGIFRMTYNFQFDTFEINSISNEKIKSFLVSIPLKNQILVKGTYDTQDEIIYWLYHDTDADIGDDGSPDGGYLNGSFYKKVLVYNTRTGAFYPWVFGSYDNLSASTPRIRGLIYVTDAIGTSKSAVKYAVTDIDGIIGSQQSYAQIITQNNTYLDWSVYATEVNGGVGASDYESSFMTGYRIHGDGLRFVQPGYILVYLDNEENSSCKMQAVYDFTNSGNSGRWSVKQEIYNSGLSLRNVNNRRLKLRGKGRSVQFRFTSSTGKPFIIIGWCVLESQTQGI